MYRVRTAVRTLTIKCTGSTNRIKSYRVRTAVHFCTEGVLWDLQYMQSTYCSTYRVRTVSKKNSKVRPKYVLWHKKDRMQVYCKVRNMKCTVLSKYSTYCQYVLPVYLWNFKFFYKVQYVLSVRKLYTFSTQYVLSVHITYCQYVMCTVSTDSTYWPPWLNDFLI